jgi:hypothetical protein
MHMALYVPFQTLTMAYILIKMSLAFHVLFWTLIMLYVFFKMCITSVMVNILVKMYLAHNIILDASFQT